ncbi:hypothetical protein GDO86_002323 [Hymenochirus boettgeri]|uniref:DNA polymerase kappa n=1 Tax=Hymenochirus boettgeri TaxID=247094 RepID=A0A8T2KHI5_9PIPI|nr:hypothetical protein GDO86_002323 [Hymenochirus boettgeri]
MIIYFVGVKDPAVDGGTKELCTSPILFEDSPSLEVEQNAHVSAATSAKQPLKKFVVFGTSAEEAVNEMRFRIEQETTLTASAGIAPNMMLAKVCSDKNKPNGQYRIVSERQAVKDFIKDLPIRKVPGIGKVTEKMLKALGVMTCTDLYQQRALLSLLFSETSWQNFLHISLGIGSTHIERDGERKSMSTERTFSEISCTKEQYDLCRELCKDLAQDLLKEGLKGKTVTLKLKNVKFEVRTRALTVTSAVSTEEEIFSVAKEILKTEIDLASPESLRLRLMGVRVSGFLNEETKKHQKSIVGFLQNEKSGNAVPLGPPDRTSPSTQTPGPQRQSFFNQKRAAREQMGRETFTDSSGFSKGAEIDSAEPRTEMPQTEVLPQKPDYFCPICSQNKSDWDLESFNKHIDRCLTGSPLANDFDVRPKAEVNINNDDWEKEINSNEIRNAAFSIQNLSNQTLDTEPINDIVYKNTIESNIVTNIRNFHTFGVDPDSVCTEKEVDVCNTEKEPAKPNSEMASSDQIFICPVCNVKQDVPDLAAFNRHVDICLNEGIIEKLREERVNINHPTHNLQHTGGTGRGLTSTNAKLRTKRSAATNQNPVSKKSKPNPSKNTIDRFFK